MELFEKKAILIKPIGEQEKGNVGYALKESNFKYLGNDWSKLNETVQELLNIPTSIKNENYLPRRDFNESKKIVDKIISLLS